MNEIFAVHRNGLWFEIDDQRIWARSVEVEALLQDDGVTLSFTYYDPKYYYALKAASRIIVRYSESGRLDHPHMGIRFLDVALTKHEGTKIENLTLLQGYDNIPTTFISAYTGKLVHLYADPKFMKFYGLDGQRDS